MENEETMVENTFVDSAFGTQDFAEAKENFEDSGARLYEEDPVTVLQERFDVEQKTEDSEVVTDETYSTELETKEEIDFSGKSFEETQKLLNLTSKLREINNGAAAIKNQKHGIIEHSIAPLKTVSVNNGDGPVINNPDDVLQYHLDKFNSAEELNRYLAGSVKSDEVKTRINEFFIHPITGEMLVMNNENTTLKTEEEELEFKRSLVIFFKQNDEYLSKIDEEQKKLDEAVNEMNRDIASVLNPLRDNIYGYATYLIDHAQPSDEDDIKTKSDKRRSMVKGIAIRSAYTLENMFKLIEDHPGIIGNSLMDFKSPDKVKEIGQRYIAKLHTAGIDFNLFMMLDDDPKKNLEYLALPKGTYKEGMEGFTIFFVIRSLAMSLPDEESIYFHAACHIAFSQLMNGKLDPSIADIMKKNITKFLKLFE